MAILNWKNSHDGKFILWQQALLLFRLNEALPNKVRGYRPLADFSGPNRKLTEMVDLMGNHMAHDFTPGVNGYTAIGLGIAEDTGLHTIIPGVNKRLDLRTKFRIQLHSTSTI